MAYGNDWGNNFLLLGFIILLLIIGMALTLISFIVHRNAHLIMFAVKNNNKNNSEEQNG